MTFFSKFPVIQLNQDNAPKVIRDFFRRVVLSDRFRNNTVLMEDYIVLDGETPELVSNKFYESPYYHWVVLLVNNIINPREEWPIPENKVIEQVYMNYDMIITVPSGAAYTVDDELQSSTGGKFIVMSKSSNTIYIRSQNGYYPLNTSNTINNLTTEVTGLVISTVTLPENRVHHYYDTSLECIMDYDAGNLNLITVTNLEHELEQNDAKRAIKVLSPEYLGSLDSEFTRLVNKP